jgi:hypothetical protein
MAMNYIIQRALVIGLLIFSCTMSMAQEENDNNAVYESSVLFTLPGVEAESMYSNPSLDTFFIHSQDTLYTVKRDGTVISKDSSDIIYGCFEGENMYYLKKGYNQETNIKEDLIINQFGDTLHRYTTSSPVPSRKFLAVNKDTFYINHDWIGSRSVDRIYRIINNEYIVYAYGDYRVKGLFFYNNKLYSIHSHNNIDVQNFIMSHDYHNSDPYDSDLILTLTNSWHIGLVIKDETFYTYCNNTNQLLMIEKQQVNSVQEITDSESDGNPVYYGFDGILNLPNESRIQIIRQSDGTTKKVLKR